MVDGYRSAHEPVQVRAFPGRTFQFWMYRVSHGELLVRSPRSSEGHETNVDIAFVGTDYVELPHVFPDFEVEEAAAPDDVAFAEERLGEGLGRSRKAFVFHCENRRYLVVAAWMRIRENTLDIFELPTF